MKPDLCAGCSLIFSRPSGGYYIARPVATYDDFGAVCQWCGVSIKKIGIEVFKKRLEKGK